MEINRRDFFKIVGLGTGAAVAASLPNVEIKGQENIDYRSTMENPLNTIDYVLRKIDAKANSNLQLSDGERGFVAQFGRDPENMVAQRNRQILDSALREKGYGKRIVDIYTLATSSNRVRDVRSLLTAFDPYYMPGLHMNTAVAQSLEYDLVPGSQAIIGFLNLVHIFEPVAYFTGYAQQKAAYMQRAVAQIDSFGLEKTLEKEIGQRPGTPEDWDTTRSGNKVIKALVGVLRRKFPAMFSGIRYIDSARFGYGNTRSYNKTLAKGEDGIFIETSDINFVSKVYERARRGQDTSIYDFSYIVSDLVHEAGHSVDPNSEDGIELNNFHPKDVLDFFATHLLRLEKINNLILGNKENGSRALSAKEIQLLHCDPLWPGGYGIDQIVGEGQLYMFMRELNLIEQVVDFLDNRKDKALLLKRTGMTGYFGNKNKEDLLGWRAIFGNLPMNEYGLGTHNDVFADHQNNLRLEDVKTRFSQFTHISKEHLEEMRNISQEVFESKNEPYYKQEMFRAILKMKSEYMFAAFSLIGQLVDDDTIFDGDPVVYAFLSLRDTIYYHFIHAAIPPLGGYLPLAGQSWDIREDMNVKLEEAVQKGKMVRDQQAENPAIKYSGREIKLSEYVTSSSVDIARVIARLWGGDIASPWLKGHEEKIYQYIPELLTQELSIKAENSRG